MKSIISIGIIALIVVAALYFYNESQKSDIEKAADEVSDTIEDLAD